MTGLVRKATLFGVCALMAASTALANVPDPTNSDIGGTVNGNGNHFIYVVGQLGGVTPDAKGTFTVTVRDFANNPISGSQVQIKFENACDINLCTAVVNGQTVDCDSSIVSGITDAAGHATFTILGAAKASNYNAGGGYARVGVVGTIIVEASGTKIGAYTAAVLDQDGAFGGANNALNGADLGKLAADVGLVAISVEPYIGRADQNADELVNGADLGKLAADVGRVAISGGSTCSATFCKQASCP